MNIDTARDLHLKTFREVFQLPQVHIFGDGAGNDDGNEGVQWNAWVGQEDGGPVTGTVGVNLEGKKYDGWPVARLIERELDGLVLFRVMADVGRSEEITVRWSRDVWMTGGSRLPPIYPQYNILRIRLSELTSDKDKWRDALFKAKDCLKRDNRFPMRGWQPILWQGITTHRDVTPHLQIVHELWRDEPPPEAVLVTLMQDVRRQLLPLHREIADLSKDTKVTLAEAQRDIEAMEAEERYEEGGKSLVLVNHYERNSALRARALEIHGTSCQGCRFSFEEVYGERGRGYIEVHHLKPLASYAGGVTVDPRTDMAVVCSNCHRMVHRHPGSPLSLEGLRMILRR